MQIVSLKKTNQINWRKKKIDLKQIIGKPYNTYYSVDTWRKCNPILKFSCIEPETEEEGDVLEKRILIQKDNRDLVDNNEAQTLTNE